MRITYHDRGAHAARTHGRIRRLGRALVGKFLSDVEAENAEALLDAERQELREKVASYNRGLAAHAALCTRLRKRSKVVEKESGELERRARRRLDAGDREAAARLCLRREKLQEELALLGEQLEAGEATYQELVSSRETAVAAARERLEQLKHGIGDLKVQRALADITETSAGLQGSLCVDDGHLERLQERIDDERELAAGRVRVAQESALLAHDPDLEDDEEGLADEALARFEQESGEGA